MTAETVPETAHDRVELDKAIEYYTAGLRSQAFLGSFLFPVLIALTFLPVLPLLLLSGGKESAVAQALLLIVLALVAAWAWRLRSKARRLKRNLLKTNPRPCHYELRTSDSRALGWNTEGQPVPTVVALISTQDGEERLWVVLGPPHFEGADFRVPAGSGETVGGLKDEYSMLITVDGKHAFLSSEHPTIAKHLPDAWKEAVPMEPAP